MIENNRNFMKCPSFAGEMAKSDQQNGVAPPPVSHPSKGNLIQLPSFENISLNNSYTNLLDSRRSQRVFDESEAMTKEQLAFMLYTTAAIQEFRGNNNAFTLRPAPSGGARHAFEIYITIQNVEGLKPGIYRYHPLAHVNEKAVSIEFINDINKDDYAQTITDMCVGQKWAGSAACTIFISCVPYRAEWRYRENAHRVVLIDLGHYGQNIMLSATALGLGSCCIAAYDQEVCDKVLGLDGNNEYTVYAVPVGAIVKKEA